MASTELDSLSLTDLDRFNDEQYLSGPSSSFHRGSDSPNSASLDLEMDYMPGPPSYEESVAPLTTNPQLPSTRPSPLRPSGPGLRGPNTQSPASRRRPPLGSSDKTSDSTSSRQERRNPMNSEEGDKSNGAQSQPRHRRTQAKPKGRDLSTPGLTVDLTSSGSGNSQVLRRTTRRTSNGNASAVVQIPVKSKSTRVDTKKANSVTVTLQGANVVINNNIGVQLAAHSHVQTRAQKKASRRPLPAKGSKRPISTEDIELLSPLLGDNWFGIGWSLGVDKGVLENIRVQYERDQCEMTRQMFCKWKAKFGRKATINYVLEALTDEKYCMYDVAERIPKD